MNKYFLSLMSILILFQSFKVFDEIFYPPTTNKNITVSPDINEVEKSTILIEDNKKNIDLDGLFELANIEKGIKLSKQCVACHDFSNNLKIKVGPPLWGVVGRDAAIIADYKYSDAFVKLQTTWSKSELFKFLENPKQYVKGTKMIYKGISKASDRVDLISYLASLN